MTPSAVERIIDPKQQLDTLTTSKEFLVIESAGNMHNMYSQKKNVDSMWGEFYFIDGKNNFILKI